MLVRKCSRFRPVARADLVVDIGDVAFSGCNADDQLGCNFSIGGALPDEAQYVYLALRQAVGQLRRVGRHAGMGQDALLPRLHVQRPKLRQGIAEQRSCTCGVARITVCERERLVVIDDGSKRPLSSLFSGAAGVSEISGRLSQIIAQGGHACSRKGIRTVWAPWLPRDLRRR